MRFSLAAKIDASAAAGPRNESAARFSMRQAHELTMAAVDGIARACKHGQVAAAAVIIVMDDSAVANRLRACYGVEVEEIPHHDSEEQDTRSEGRWIEVFRSSERARRSSFGIGQQADRAGSD
jgi:aminoglycoside N3'-acetyltransferase